MKTHNPKVKASIMKAIESDNALQLSYILGELKGDYAVKYILEIFLDRKAGYTITAVNDILSRA